MGIAQAPALSPDGKTHASLTVAELIGYVGGPMALLGAFWYAIRAVFGAGRRYQAIEARLEALEARQRESAESDRQRDQEQALMHRKLDALLLATGTAFVE